MEEDHESGIFSQSADWKMGGTLTDVSVDYLAAKVIQAVVDRSYIKKYENNEVILLKISI
ncbi:hypothetical protein [Peribacillus frigoritolerans]|uniref:hypothetical protein n=1 Tax=Peribacillus frigoritolerans TaxID=450367 RepID=UPI003305E695